MRIRTEMNITGHQTKRIEDRVQEGRRAITMEEREDRVLQIKEMEEMDLQMAEMAITSRDTVREQQEEIIMGPVGPAPQETPAPTMVTEAEIAEMEIRNGKGRTRLQGREKPDASRPLHPPV